MDALHDETPLPRLQNVVATFVIADRLDLVALTMKCGFVYYLPSKFAAAVIKLTEPRTTCLIFSSGKAVCTGAKSEHDASVACMKFVMLLRGSGIQDVCFRNLSIQNLVAAVHCPFNLDLCKLAHTVSGFCSYEPNLFPGLVYRGKFSTNVAHLSELVFICFSSGRCVVTGGKDREHVLNGWGSFYQTILLNFRATINHGSSGNFKQYVNKRRRFEYDNANFNDRYAVLLSVGAMLPRVKRALLATSSSTDDVRMLSDEAREQATLSDIWQVQKHVPDTPTASLDAIRLVDDMHHDHLITSDLSHRRSLCNAILSNKM